VEQGHIIFESNQVITGNKALPIGKGYKKIPSAETVKKEEDAHQSWQDDERRDDPFLLFRVQPNLLKLVKGSLKLSMKEQEMGMAQKENVQMSHPHLGSLTPVG
jgi:hypothetical protein